MKLRNKKGFSLVELIIVIAILGIIAVIAVPNLTNVQKSSQVNADIRTAEQIGKAIRIWLTDCDIQTAVTRETSISSTNMVLYSGLDKITDYVAGGYTANALSNGKFYVCLINNKVIVSISGDATAPAKPTNSSAEYKLDNGAAKAGVAYVEGSSSLTSGISNL